MIFPIKNLPVNWVDGMKVSKKHFEDSDKYLQDKVRDLGSIQITTYSFGLLPAAAGDKKSFELHVSGNDTASIEIKLNYCNAITEGGFRIAIDTREFVYSGLATTIKADSQNNNSDNTNYEIVLVSNPYERVPAGNPSLQESPPRHPYAEVKYNLNIIPGSQINTRSLSAYHLVVGRIVCKGGKFSYLENYIPPSYNIYSHPALISYYETFLEKVQNIQNLSFRIVKKIQDKNKPSSLAGNFMMLCKEVLGYIAGVSFRLRNQLPHQSPVFTVECFSAMANVIHSTLVCINSAEKEELIKYIHEWCEIPPGDVENIFINMIEVKYNHYEINSSFASVNSYLGSFEQIWSKLETLEFIGQRKENIVVTHHTVQPQVDKSKKRWSILD